MDDVIEAMAAMQQYPVLYASAQYGLQWHNHMRELAEFNINEVQHGHEILTHLQPCMLAAAGTTHFGLSSIYEQRVDEDDSKKYLYHEEDKTHEF